MSGSSTPQRRAVTVLACHYDQGQSMRRYGDLLVDAYRQAGWDVEVRRPIRSLSRRVDSGALHKLLVYVEKLALFPLQLSLRPPRTLVHLTDHSDAPWLRRIRRSTRKLATCHDLIAIRAGAGDVDVYRPRWSGRLYQRYIRSSLGRADLIAAVSESTLADVRHAFPTMPTHLLYNPLPPGVTEVATPPASTEASPYLLLVAASGWRKRRFLSIEAWRRIRAVSRQDLRLVIVGDELDAGEREAAGLPGGAEPGLEIRTDVPNEALAALYANATGLVMMSSHEGFGWPVAEANHWGTVAVCTDIPVFHEVGPNNIFVSDDLDANDWAAVWAQLQDGSRGPLVEHDATRFTPQVFAAELSALATGLLPPRGGTATTAGSAETSSD